MPSRLFQLQQGTPVTAASTVQLLPSGLTGTRGARRRLVHPDGASFPALVYYRNPDRTFNFDSDVLRHPIVSVTRTLSSTKVVRFEEVTEDVVVVERWEANGGLSVPVFFLRQLYNLLVNPPAFDSVNQTYVIWEPRDESDDTYRVELIGLQVGGGAGAGRFNIKKYVTRGGPTDPTNPGVESTPSEVLEVSPTGFLDQPVDLTMRVVEKV